MKIQEKILTPADAAKLLASAGPNQKRVRSRVANLASAIERGEWAGCRCRFLLPNPGAGRVPWD